MNQLPIGFTRPKIKAKPEPRPADWSDLPPDYDPVSELQAICEAYDSTEGLRVAVCWEECWDYREKGQVHKWFNVSREAPARLFRIHYRQKREKQELTDRKKQLVEKKEHQLQTVSAMVLLYWRTKTGAQIAELAGVSHKIYYRARRKLEMAGIIPTRMQRERTGEVMKANLNRVAQKILK